MLDNIYNYIKKGGITFIILCFTLIMNHSFGYITLLGVFIVVFFFSYTIKKGTINNKEFILLFSLGCYIIISSINGYKCSVYEILLNLLTPFFFFQYGGFVVKKWQTENELIIFWITIIVCYCLDAYLVGIENIISTGQIAGSLDERNLSVESQGVTYVVSATQLGLCLDIAVVGLSMSIIAKEKTQKVSFLLMFIFALVVTFNMLNRTAIIITFVCLFVVNGYRSRKNVFVFIISVLLVLASISLLFYTGIINDELVELYTDRNEDLSTAGNRTQRWDYAVEQLFMFPFGWGDGKTYYIHNMWLDIARISGLIPFIALAYFALNSFKESIKMIKIHETSLMYLILGLNVCFFASCFVEPITGGTHFMLYCMLWGFQNALSNKN